jgi:glycosyltransferase involved in cell wall biosynthesis
MGMRDRGCDVLGLAAELGIADRLLSTTAAPEHPHVPEPFLNDVYNACDLGLNTCEAEGWGLVAFEHAATGAAQVVPDGSACAELWADAGTVVPTTPTVRAGHEVAPAGVAAALARLYDDRDELARMSRVAREHATAPHFSWDAIAGGWARVLGAQAAGVGADGAVRSNAAQPVSRSRTASSAAAPPRNPNSRLANSR